jgi:hypothetical protein
MGSFPTGLTLLPSGSNIENMSIVRITAPGNSYYFSAAQVHNPIFISVIHEPRNFGKEKH